MLRQTQQLKLLQKLSPQQIQLMKLFQVSTASLEERIKEELEANPALDTGKNESDNYEDSVFNDENKSEDGEYDNGTDDSIDVSDYLMSEGESTTDYYTGSNDDDDDDTGTIPIKVETSFHDHLHSQLGMLDLDPRLYVVAEQVVGSIDDDGYLRRSPEAIADDLAFKQNIQVSDDEVKHIIKLIQEFDPPGVGASTLQECLLIQLNKTAPNESVKNAIHILKEYFEEFTKKHYDKIKAQLKLTDAAFKAAINAIIKLTPKPGAPYSNGLKDNGYIIPDFFIYNDNGKLELMLNAKNAPDLRISEGYKEMLKAYDKGNKKDKKQKEAVQFIKQKIDSAKWFIDAIKQRQHTLLITMNAILEQQKEFFYTGDESALKPMILKDIAEVTDMDISTVSRVANSKYVQTEFGTYSLKHFFSEGIKTEQGEEVSNREIKNYIETLIASEDKSKPFSDEKLMELLTEKGYKLARRTIAKYREQLEIPVARLRKEA